MQKKLLFVIILLILIIVTLVARFYFSNTTFSEREKYLYIRTGHTSKETVIQNLKDNNLIRNPRSFEFLATQMDVWEKIKPGKYAIKKGMGLLDIARMLRNSTQEPVNLVITKLRTRENFSSLIGRKFETDSVSFMEFLTNTDSVKKFGLDTNTVMTAIFPNTYTYLWTTSPSGIFRKLFAEYKKVWTPERKARANTLGLSPTTAYILASIVEEETTNKEEKGLMASVYLNRLAKNMNLGADPTVKFALRNFALKRIYEKHLATESPYNTYRYKGLPPGPICTPSLETLDEVLNAPKTNYLFFVAKKDFSQGHVFTSTYSDHLKYAREYQEALNLREKQKQQKAAFESAE